MLDQRLPWDVGQVRRSDFGFMAGALALCISIPLVTVPPRVLKPVPIAERTVLLPPTVVLPTPPKPEPKPEPKVEPKPEPKQVEPKPEPKIEPKPEPKAKVEPKPVVKAVTPPPAKAAPPAPKAVTPTQSGSPDKPAVKTVLPTTTAPTPPVKTGPTAAELREAAQRRAQATVRDTGLSSAIGNLTTSSSKAKPVEGQGLQKGGVEGGKADVKLNTAASTGKKASQDFGSATEGDKTGKAAGNLSGRGTKDVSGAQIRDSANTQSAGKSGGDSAPKGKSKRGDVERVMSQAKGRLNSAYKRALDEDPTMQGSITVKLKISASGQVTSASIVSSDLNNSALEAKMLAIIKGMNFDDGEYDTWDDTYRFNFIPQ